MANKLMLLLLSTVCFCVLWMADFELKVQESQFSKKTENQYAHYLAEQCKKHLHKGVYYKIGSAYEIDGVTYHPKYNPHYKKVGMASWYGPGFDGRKTANGDVFNTNDLTAASPDLPLFSRVWVTNLETGVKILVTVNDRGPYAKGRIMDLSNAAAKMLGYVHEGVAKVKVEYDKKETEDFLKAIGLYNEYLKKTHQLKTYASR